MSDCTHDDWRYQPKTTDTRGRTYGPYRVCDHCSTGLVLAAIPAGHPESMTAELGDDIEKMLAALDERLDPDRANEEV